MASALKTEEERVSWLIQKAKAKLEINMYESKSWLLTGMTMFPTSFLLKFELYRIAKEQKHAEEAAQHLAAMYKNAACQESPELMAEVRLLVQSAQTDSVSPDNRFLSEIFSGLPESVQCDILKQISQSTADVIAKASYMLLLVKRFPHLAKEYASPLIESLFAAELAESPDNPRNMYRKFLVTDALPFLLKENLGVDRKALFNWLDKAIQFYILSAFNTQPSDSFLISSGIKSPTTSSGGSSVYHVTRPWAHLADLLVQISRHVRWTIDSSHFQSNAGLIDHLKTLKQKLSREHSKSAKKELIYNGTYLLLKTIHSYVNRITPRKDNSQSECLFIQTVFSVTSSTDKKRKAVTDNSCKILIKPDIQNHEDVMAEFETSCELWRMLHCESGFVKAFDDLLGKLDYPTWQPAVQLYHLDRLLYQREYKKLLSEVASDGPFSMNKTMKKSCCEYALGQKKDLVTSIYSVLDELKLDSEDNAQCDHAAGEDNSGHEGNVFTFTQKSVDIFHLCADIILCLLQENIGSSDSTDDLLGNVVVLSQLMWPKRRDVFESIIDHIREQGSFTYPGFFDYIINIEALEEFAYLTSEQGGSVKLEIMPITVKQVKLRTVTRGAEKGAQEGIKQAFEKQVSKCMENIDSYLLNFLISKRDEIMISV